MSETKHTAGRWQFLDTGEIVSSETGDSIAMVLLPEGHEDNAQLIAAAPDMLEALKPFVDHAQNRCADDPTWSDEETVKIVVTIGDLRRVSSAIDKARGR